jgi:hypothetical protein
VRTFDTFQVTVTALSSLYAMAWTVIVTANEHRDTNAVAIREIKLNNATLRMMHLERSHKHKTDGCN